MIKAISVTNEQGETLNIDLFNPASSGFAITNITGLGPVNATINTSSYATRDGSVFDSARLDNRNIVLSVIFIANDGDTIEDVRQRSYKFFPIKGKITLIIKTDNRNAKTTGYVESNEPDIFSSDRESAQISIICPDPYFYDNTTKQKISFLEKVRLFHFPFYHLRTKLPGTSIEVVKNIKMGEVMLLRSKTFTYNGEKRSGIIIKLLFSGDVTGKITITNKTTGQSITVDTDLFPDKLKTIQNGDYLRIDTLPGERTVRFYKKQSSDAEHDYIYYNVLSSLASGSDWIEVVHGENNIAVSTSTQGDSEKIEVSVTTIVKYEGV